MSAVGITNEGKTFPVAFVWIPGETTEVWGWFLECLRHEIFGDGVLDPAVVLTDMALGVIVAVDKLAALLNSQLQYCIWHAQQAIIAWIRKGRYIKDEVDELKALVWDYLQSATESELAINRAIVRTKLQPAEQAYLDSWSIKEGRTVHCFTNRYRNLGARASSRVESWHRVPHDVLNGQMLIEQSARQLTARGGPSGVQVPPVCTPRQHLP